jgi:hypothetical protein
MPRERDLAALVEHAEHEILAARRRNDIADGGAHKC